ncbi:MAG TPA: MBL fold metallo-hydrolase [Solirubrobacteraceae bacterium]|jgi:glyoxylase-like metal-dependent hydrolase (beta-lactamase superfamily II)|nr:MBL fold metallo-hydrolase [Solirubrobacteraceae bacterium]
MPPTREIPLDVRTPAPGVRRFTVPLPFPSPDHLHVHVLDTPDGELLVDCGAVGSEDALRAGLEAVGAAPTRLLITHAHIDHWGIATRVADQVLAHPAVTQAFDFIAQARGEGGGTPNPMRDAMRSAFGDLVSMYDSIPEVEPIHDGDRIGDWEVLFTPGHDPGHVCLFREGDGVLLCGDVLLPGYTPNIQPAADGSDALADFLASVSRLASLPVSLVLPSHGEPYADAAGRAAELLAHHEKRLTKLRVAMADGTTSLRDLRNATFSLGDGSRGDRMLAAMETFAHLEHLRLRGEAQMAADGSWSLAA